MYASHSGMALLGCDVVTTDQVEVLPLLMRNVERNKSWIAQSNPESGLLSKRTKESTIHICNLGYCDDILIITCSQCINLMLCSLVVS